VWFNEILRKYYGHSSPYELKNLMEFSVGYKFEGKNEEGKNIWGSREENYLPKKLSFDLDLDEEEIEES
jgi:hypothetical protein